MLDVPNAIPLLQVCNYSASPETLEASGGQNPSEGSTNCGVHRVTNRVIQRRTTDFSFVSASFNIYKSWISKRKKRRNGISYRMVAKLPATVKLLQNYWWIETKKIAGLPRCWVYKNFPERNSVRPSVALTFWQRNYFFLILAHSVYKMWTIHEPNKLELWNKLHFKEKKTESIHHV